MVHDARGARGFVTSVVGWMYLKADGAILTDKDVHFSQTLNGPLVSIGIPF